MQEARGQQAAQAAAAALRCALDEAGPAAARKAATAGAAALQASPGMQGLGGLQEASAKLRRCVQLPLQVSFV